MLFQIVVVFFQTNCPLSCHQETIEPNNLKKCENFKEFDKILLKYDLSIYNFNKDQLIQNEVRTIYFFPIYLFIYQEARAIAAIER